MTGFSGLTNASRALAAHTYALDVIARNIANADTPGYTRERADLAATGPAGGVARLHSVDPSVAGTVDASGVSRLNDTVLDARARTQHGRSGYLDAKAATLSGVEALVDEPSDNGLAEQLNSFWNAWSGVQNAPGDTSARNTLLSSATAVATTLNSTATGLIDLSNNTRDALQLSLTQVNQAAQGVGELNAQIKVATAAGQPTAALLDQRDALLTSLSDSVGAGVTLQPDNTVVVTLGSAVLVSGNTVAGVGLDASDNVTVGGIPVTLSGGSVKAQSEALTITIPGYLSALDSVASSLASTVNTVHAGGFDLNGSAGGAFFTGSTAATIATAITDPKKIAASATGNGTPDLDGSVAARLAALASAPGGADAGYRTLVAGLGSAVQNANQQSALQTAVTSGVDSLQASVSGVNYDDEVTNMLAFQRAYQASSRVLTTVDDMLDTLINRTGRVGL
jgi:flagellar hook-associated protein 1 FlgK